MKAIYFTDQRSPQRKVRKVRFDPAVEESLQEIHDALCRRWRLTDRPSVSLLLAGVIRQYAESVKSDPNALKDLMAEIRRRGGPVGSRRRQLAVDLAKMAASQTAPAIES